MFFLLLLPFSLLSWFLGVLHAKGKGSAKFGFLALLILTVPLDLQGLVIFITAFFMLGFLYEQEGSTHALYLRLKAVLGKNTPQSSTRAGKKGRKQRFEYKKKRKPPPKRGDQGSREPKQEQASTDNQANDRYRDEVRKQREEEMRQKRAGHS